MPLLIVLDKDGNELKRSKKGRGRAPKGFRRRPDGDWYKIISNAVAVPHAGVESITPDLPRVSAPARGRPKSKGVQFTGERASIDSILGVCNYTKLDRLDNGTVILESPLIVRPTGVKGLEYNSLFNRMELDPTSGNIRIFLPNLPDGPPITIYNVLLKGDSDAD